MGKIEIRGRKKRDMGMERKEKKRKKREGKVIGVEEVAKKY